MTIKYKGNVRTQSTTTKESIAGGHIRRTIVTTDKAGKLSPDKIGAIFDGDKVKSSVVNTKDGIDTKTTIVESSAQGVATLSYRVSAVTSEEPIETHPAFIEPQPGFGIGLGGTGAEPKNDAVFEPRTTEGEFQFFPPNAPNELGGVTSYLVPAVIFEATVTSTDFNLVGQWDNIYDIGKIKRIPININVGPERNWLVVGVLYDYDKDTTEWSVTVQYQLSGPRGWNRAIYASA